MAKILKVIELLAESDHSWEDAAARRSGTSQRNCPAYPLRLCGKFHGGGLSRRDQELSDQC